jgi:SAM-dependent methyltransferase
MKTPELPASLQFSYDVFPRIEEDFEAMLADSLQPRGPNVLYDLVEAFGLPAESVAIDVGCAEGRHSFELAERFRFAVTGLDPVPRHIAVASDAVASLPPDIAARVRFQLGTAEALPLADESVDLVWCRDVLVHVGDLDRAYADFERVLRPGGRVLVYQMFAGDRLEPREAEWLWQTASVVPTSADPARTEAAISAAGLHVDERLDAREWGEWAQEQFGTPGTRLLYTARLLRKPERYVSRFGEEAYELMLSSCIWHVYGMMGKLRRTVYVLSKTA